MVTTGTIPRSVASFAVPKIFSTWAGTFTCKPQGYFQPESIGQIISLVNEARENKKTLTTVGSGHSPSYMNINQDWIVNLDKFQKIVSITPHKSGKYTDIEVEAGIRIYQLNEFLATKGLAIQNLGSISEQSIAGIISTGTHGSSPYHGLVSSQIVNLTLVNGKGELVKCSPHENPDLFRGACLSLGKLGLIAYATIRTVPRYQIKSTQEIITFDTLLKIWDTVWTEKEFLRVWWFPYARRCVLWRASKTEEPLSAPRSSWYGTRFGRFFYESLLWISVHIFPRFTPYVERFVFGRQYGITETLGRGDVAVQESVDGLNMDCLFSQFVNEWALPLTNGPEILRSLEHSINTAAKNGDFFVHAPIEVRCSNTTVSNSLEDPDVSNRTVTSAGSVNGNNLRPILDLTPKLKWAPQENVTNSQMTLYVNATMYRPFRTNSPIGKWYQIFEKTMELAGGRPHWAKNFIGKKEYCPPNYLKSSYKDGEMIGFAAVMPDWVGGEDLDLFKKIRKEQDPDGVFLGNKEWAIINGIVDETD